MRLDFTGLPLLEVQLKLVTSEPLDIPFDAIGELRAELKERLPNIVQHAPPTPPAGQGVPAFLIQFGLPMPVASFSNAGGLSATIQSNLVSVSWTKPSAGTAEYPRFEVLREVAKTIHDLLIIGGSERKPLAVVNLSYANFLAVDSTSFAHLAEYLKPEVLPSFASTSTIFHDLNYSWRTESGNDHRVQVAQVSVDGGVTNGFLLATSGGVLLGSNHEPFEALDLLHESMQQWFINMMSEKAKEDWNLNIRTIV